jgi:hypothetical protein
MTNGHGYSAKVALKLQLSGTEYDLSHVEHEAVIVRSPCQPTAAQDAVLVIQVGETIDHYDVLLPQGLSATGLPTPFVRRSCKTAAV